MSCDPIEILLVEDTLSDVQLTLHSFKKIGLANHIQVARDGEEALDILFSAEARPRLILLDLKLPKIDGLQVLRRIKADPHTQKIPVVILTSSAEHPDIEECYKLGANSYIVKPVDFDQFVKATQNLGMYWLLLNQPAIGIESGQAAADAFR